MNSHQSRPSRIVELGNVQLEDCRADLNSNYDNRDEAGNSFISSPHAPSQKDCGRCIQDGQDGKDEAQLLMRQEREGGDKGQHGGRQAGKQLAISEESEEGGGQQEDGNVGQRTGKVPMPWADAPLGALVLNHVKVKDLQLGPNEPSPADAVQGGADDLTIG